MQKRLVLSNLKELFVAFKEDCKEKDIDIKISFSKFCELRPPYCVLAGASGTHTVCVCDLHQNFKLMVEAANLKDNDEKSLDYKGIIQKIVCESPTEKCYLSKCEKCPGTEWLQELMEVTFDERCQSRVHS